MRTLELRLAQGDTGGPIKPAEQKDMDEGCARIYGFLRSLQKHHEGHQDGQYLIRAACLAEAHKRQRRSYMYAEHPPLQWHLQQLLPERPQPQQGQSLRDWLSCTFQVVMMMFRPLRQQEASNSETDAMSGE